MKFGFRITYHKSIPYSKELLYFLESQKTQFCSPDSYKCRTDSGAFFRRGLLGLAVGSDFQINQNPVIYTFKRLSRNRRVFGLVPISLLVPKNPPINLEQCMCAIHRGGQRVNLAVPYNESDYETYFETGNIKG